jgi:starch phosphorylase
MGGHVAFLENYDMHMAKFLVQGVDIWLNTPRFPLEASGTSGQKAALNGVMNLSVLDGWWKEGYNGANGWGIEPLTGTQDIQAQDEHDAQQIYRMLEQEATPLYYQRDLDGIPRGWLQLMKESLRTNAPRFCTKRMVKEYADNLYAPAMVRTPSTW